MTQLHFPTISHLDFEGRTGKGDFADSLVEMDARVGQIIDAIEARGLRDDTLFIFASDNGPDPIPGPRFNLGLRGMKYEITEGGIRVPMLLQWK